MVPHLARLRQDLPLGAVLFRRERQKFSDDQIGNRVPLRVGGKAVGTARVVGVEWPNRRQVDLVVEVIAAPPDVRKALGLSPDTPRIWTPPR